MYRIRPVWGAFLRWLILLPMFWVEGLALGDLLDAYALRDPAKTAPAWAEITGSRPVDDEVQVQYRFQAQAGEEWYSASDMTGRRNLWIPLTDEAWAEASQTRRIEVTYLIDDPWANTPLARAGNPLADNWAGWLMFVALDIYSLYELVMIFWTFTLCRSAAERQLEMTTKYWSSLPV